MDYKSFSSPFIPIKFQQNKPRSKLNLMIKVIVWYVLKPFK